MLADSSCAICPLREYGAKRMHCALADVQPNVSVFAKSIAASKTRSRPREENDRARKLHIEPRCPGSTTFLKWPLDARAYRP